MALSVKGKKRLLACQILNVAGLTEWLNQPLTPQPHPRLQLSFPFSSVQVGCSRPGFPVYHQLPFPCRFIMRVRAQSLQLCPALCDPMDCSPPGSSVHALLQAGIL